MKQNGFTLFELMVVVALIGILASFAIPNLAYFIHNQHLIAEAKELQAGFQKAKGLAVARNEQVYVEYANDKSWTVYNSTGAVIEASPNTSPAHVQMAITPVTAYRATYNGFGMLTTNADGSDIPTSVDITSNGGLATMSYRLILGGGSVRLCEPNRPVNDARSC